MLQAINTWEDYRARLREFDAVLEHAKAVASSLDGLQARTPQMRYGVQIFLKLLSHALALRRLAVDQGTRTPKELWDVPSMAAVARCAVEAHDAFEYIAGHDATGPERNFRILLWELHDETRRLKMLGDAGSAEAHTDDLRADIARRQAELEGHAFLATLRAELQAELRRRWARNDPPAFHLNQRQRCAQSGVNADWYHAVTLQLAQYVHTLPSSAQQLFEVQAGTPEANGLLALPLVVTLPFLVRITQAMAAFMPGNAPEPPSRTARTMASWRAVAEQAVSA